MGKKKWKINIAGSKLLFFPYNVLRKCGKKVCGIYYQKIQVFVVIIKMTLILILSQLFNYYFFVCVCSWKWIWFYHQRKWSTVGSTSYNRKYIHSAGNYSKKWQCRRHHRIWSAVHLSTRLVCSKFSVWVRR